MVAAIVVAVAIDVGIIGAVTVSAAAIVIYVDSGDGWRCEGDGEWVGLPLPVHRGVAREAQ